MSKLLCTILDVEKIEFDTLQKLFLYIFLNFITILFSLIY